MSGLSTTSAIFGVRDAKVYPLLTDSTGAEATYGAAIDVPGINKVTFGISSSTVENSGDETILDIESIVDKVTLDWDNCRLSLEALAAINGGATVAAGTAGTTGVPGTQTQTYTFTSNDKANYFKFCAVAKKGSGAVTDVELTVYKVIGTLTFTLTGKGFGVSSFKGEGIRLDGIANTIDNAMYSVLFSEAAITSA